jgi:hypothetical protein
MLALIQSKPIISVRKNLRCQELGIVLPSDLPLKVLSRKLELIPLGRLLAQLPRLLMQKLKRILLGDLLALGRLNIMPRPLPQLTPAHLSGGSIFHEVVDGHAANAPDPGFHVAQPDVEVLADTRFGDLSRDVHIKQVAGGDVHVFAADVHLVGAGHVFVKDFRGDGCEGGVRDPCAVVAGARFAEFVGAHFSHGGVVGLLVVLDGDLGCHAAHGVDAALVACFDEQLDVGVHEGGCHGYGVAVGEDEGGVLAEALDGAEDVVPAAAVEACGVVAQLEDDLLLSQYCVHVSFYV